MTDLEKARSVIAGLSRAEKTRVLEWIVQDLGESFPGIETSPGIAGGDPCIVRTRIPVWALIRARQLGTTESDLLRSYPPLRAEDLVHAWSSYHSHREEIDRQVRDHGAA